MVSRKNLIYGGIGLLVVVGIILAVLGGMGYLSPKSGSSSSGQSSSGGAVAPGGYDIPGSVNITGFDPITGYLTIKTDSVACQSCYVVTTWDATDYCQAHGSICGSGGGTQGDHMFSLNIDPVTHEGIIKTGLIFNYGYGRDYFGRIGFTAVMKNDSMTKSGPYNSWSYVNLAPQ